MAKYQTKMVDRPKLKFHFYVAKAFSYPKHIYNIMGNSFSWESKLINPNPLKQKRQGFVVFLGLKATLHKKYDYIPQFCF